uniref:Uncharacterized protein n=1 Tax=Lepeophtheirus salmonis TaxID=72036 RepID=A0A0K2UJK7_LEPSM
MEPHRLRMRGMRSFLEFLKLIVRYSFSCLVVVLGSNQICYNLHFSLQLDNE